MHADEQATDSELWITSRFFLDKIAGQIVYLIND